MIHASKGIIMQGRINKLTPISFNFRPRPPYVSEDHVIFLMEIAKRFSSGGPQNANIFHAADNLHAVNNPADRQLQLCGFIIGLYALGIYNKISDNWSARTYSTIVSWNVAQAVDLGPEVFQIIYDTWETHFTPSEIVALVDKASTSADERLSPMIPELSLSVLRKADALTSLECYKALNHCRDQSPQLLEKACLTIEEVE
jgi:hypothetical protein